MLAASWTKESLSICCSGEVTTLAEVATTAIVPLRPTGEKPTIWPPSSTTIIPSSPARICSMMGSG